MQPVIEIRIRSFYTSKEADIAPSSTFTVQRDDSGKEPDWAKMIIGMLARVSEQTKGIPCTEVRPMTKDEAEAFVAEENDGAQ